MYIKGKDMAKVIRKRIESQIELNNSMNRLMIASGRPPLETDETHIKNLEQMALDHDADPEREWAILPPIPPDAAPYAYKESSKD